MRLDKARSIQMKVVVLLCVLFSNLIGANETSENNTYVSASEVFQNLNVGLDVGNGTEENVQQAAICLWSGDCKNSAVCVWRGQGVCMCKNGTSGDHCEKVDECEDDIDICGHLDDVQCVYDDVQEKAVCKCDNGSKTYVPKRKQCMAPCRDDTDCNGKGNCSIEFNNLKFCSCIKRVRGDFCENSECLDLCGDTVECRYDSDWRVSCICDGYKEGFDSDAKVCRDCNCGLWANKCEYQRGKKICHCDKTSYEKDGKCVDCSCGSWSSYTGCEFYEGKKMCQCKKTYKVNKDVCEFCWCGWDSKDCKFQNGSRICTCHAGYLQDSEDICRDCDCGYYGKCALDQNNRKVCTCNVGYAESYGKCQRCDCGDNGECSFVNSKKVCKCNETYAEYNGKCEYCDCGTHGVCSFKQPYYIYNKQKKCDCEMGYGYEDDLDGLCKVCDCGNNGECYFSNGEKRCNCMAHYTPFDGKCKECSCGEWGAYDCSFNTNGEKVCICKNGYALKDGICEDCRCGPDSYGCNFTEYAKHCQCKPDYEDVGGYCKEIKISECSKSSLCPFTTVCIDLSDGDYDCKCLEGYKKRPYGNTKNVGCEDIDECHTLLAPCGTDAECSNTPGSYRCYCRMGYTEDYSTYFKSPKDKKCTKIDSSRPYRTASVVVGIILGLIIAILVCINLKRKF